MGYDFIVKSGRLRLAERDEFVRELLSLAAQLELDVTPFNWIVRGEVFQMHSKRPCVEGIHGPLVTRPVLRRDETSEHWDEFWERIDGEHIQGLVLCHPYEDWLISWNVTRDGLLAGMDLRGPDGAGLRKLGENPTGLLARSDVLFEEPAVPMEGEFWERHIGIQTPWRRSDAVAACDIFSLLARYSEDFGLWDEWNIWPEMDFSKWENYSASWAAAFASVGLDCEEAHPDVEDYGEGENTEEKEN